MASVSLRKDKYVLRHWSSVYQTNYLTYVPGVNAFLFVLIKRRRNDGRYDSVREVYRCLNCLDKVTVFYVWRSDTDIRGSEPADFAAYPSLKREQTPWTQS